MKRRNYNRFSFESLERREMMAADVALAGGVLNIGGTEMDDQVVVSQVDNAIQVTITDPANGNTLANRSFAASAVKSIHVQCLGGNDFALNNTNKPSTMYGGRGNDHLLGGAARDVVFGEMGDDLICGFAGNDLLDGGADNDAIFGEGGDGEIRGGAGFNLLSGGLGLDSLNGQKETNNLNTNMQRIQSSVLANDLATFGEPQEIQSNPIFSLSGTDLGSGRVKGLSGTDLGSSRIVGLSGTDLGSGRLW